MKKEMLRKLLALVLALILAPALVWTLAAPARASSVLNPYKVSYDDNGTVKEFSVASLATALNSARTRTITITLAGDVTETEPVSFSPLMPVTLDLNGFTLTMAGINISRGSLTICDSTKGGGCVLFDQDDSIGIDMIVETGNTAVLTLENVSMNCDAMSLIRTIANEGIYKGVTRIDVKNSDIICNQYGIDAGCKTTLTVEDSTIFCEKTAIDLQSGYSPLYPDEPYTAATAELKSSRISGLSCIDMSTGVAATVSDCHLIGTDSDNADVIDAHNATLSMEDTIMEGGHSSISMFGGTGSFAGCSFDNAIRMNLGSRGSFDSCTFDDGFGLFINDEVFVTCLNCRTFDDEPKFYFFVSEDSNYGLEFTEQKDIGYYHKIYGRIPLEKDRTYEKDDTLDFITVSQVASRFLPGEYTLECNDAEILVDGERHIHGGSKTVKKADEVSHCTETVCPDCPVAYVGRGEPQPHTESTAADCMSPAYCNECGSSYGDKLPHAFNSLTGTCDYGCGQDLAAATLTAGGTLRYYESPGEAVAAANLLETQGALKLTLLKDAQTDGEVVFDLQGSLTLDLQGKTFKAGSFRYSGGHVRVTDSSQTAGGCLEAEEYHNLQAAMTLDKGTVSGGKNGITLGAGGELSVEGGTVQGKSDYALDAGRAAADKVRLSGGIFLGGIKNGEKRLSVLLESGYGLYEIGGDGSTAFLDAGSLDNWPYDMTVLCTHEQKCYESLGGVLQAYCARSGCGQPVGSLTVQLPEDLTYNRREKAVTVKAEGALEDAPYTLYYREDGKLISGAPVDAGSYTAILSLEGVSACVDYTVNAAPLAAAEITAAGEYIYNGLPQTLTQAPGVTLEDAALVQGKDFTVTGYSGNVDAGTAAFTVTGLGNYTGTAQGSFEILPKKLRVKAGDIQDLPYGDLPEYTVTYSGFVQGEDESVLEGQLTFESSFDPQVPGKREAGIYAVTPGGLLSGNYDIIYEEGWLDVVQRSLSISVESKEVAYGDPAPAYTFRVEGLQYGETPEEVFETPVFTSGYTPGEPVGSAFPIRVSTSFSGEAYRCYYIDNTVYGDIVVKQRPITPLLAGSVSKVYDGNLRLPGDHGLEILCGSIVSGEDVSFTGEFVYETADAGTGKKVLATLTLAGADKDNYLLTQEKISGDVGQILPLDISDLYIEPALPVYYDGSQKTVAFTVPKINGLTPTCQISGNKATDVGTYEATVTGTGNFTGTVKVPYRVDVDTSPLDVIGDEGLTTRLLPEIEKILAALDTCRDDPMPEDWQTLQSNCESLRDQILDAQAAADTEAIRAAANITPENVTAGDKAVLEQAGAELKVALENNGSVYTQAEKNAILADLDRIQAALEALKDPKVSRIYGENRVETSLKTADALKAALGVEKFDAVVIATAGNYADALSGSYLANQKKAPVLLYHHSFHDQVREYIRRNLVSGGKVYILGGTQAVPASAETGLEGYAVKRLGGENRLETNLMILREAGVGSGDLIVTTALSYPDALSASALNKPILLVGKKTLLEEQKAILRGFRGRRVILGGHNAVDSRIEADVRATGETIRVEGANRVQTGIALAKLYYPQPTTAVVVYGRNYPDGLCGGPLAYALGGPVLLAVNDLAGELAAYGQADTLAAGFVLGGSGLVSDAAVREIFGLQQTTPIR